MTNWRIKSVRTTGLVTVCCALAALAAGSAVSSTLDPGGEARSMARSAHYLMLQGNVDQAIALLTQVREREPHVLMEFPEDKLQLDPTASLADCYELKGRWSDALALWEETLPLYPEGEVAAAHIGRCRAKLAAQGAQLNPVAFVSRAGMFKPPVMDAWAGNSLVAVRPACEGAGGAVAWDRSSWSASATLGDKYITFTLGSDVAVANGREVALPVAPYLNADWRMMVPLRTLAEALGGTVEWAPEPQIVYVTLPQPGGAEEPGPPSQM